MSLPPEPFHEAAATVPGPAGTYTSNLHPAYSLWGNTFVHGGFTMAVAADAMGRAAGKPDPVTLTAHFLEQVKLQPTTVATTVLRTGKRHASVAAAVVQDGVEKVRLLGTFGDTHAADGPSHHRAPPSCPPWDECVGFGLRRDWVAHLDARLHPETAGFATGTPSGKELVVGRFRFNHAERVGGPALALLADLLISPAVEMGIAGMGWIPTVELTLHVHDASHTGEVLGVIRSEHISEGYATEDVELWSGNGDLLLAVARQLALVRPPT